MEKKLFIGVSVLFGFLAVTFIGLLLSGQPEKAAPSADFGPGGLPSGSPANEADEPLVINPSSTNGFGPGGLPAGSPANEPLGPSVVSTSSPKSRDFVPDMADQGDGSISVVLLGSPASYTSLTCRLLKKESDWVEAYSSAKPVEKGRCEFGDLPVGSYRVDFFDGSSVIASREVELDLPGASVISSASAVIRLSCQDSDNGLVPAQQGTASDQAGRQAEDYCLGARSLREYSCFRDQIINSDIDCPGTCSNGACDQ